MTRLGDYLDLHDLGYPLGLLCFFAGCIAAFFALWLIAAPLVVVAFALCWWFG